MANLLEQAINTDDGDRAARIIQDALGIESDEVANYCFPKSWPADREQGARIIGDWLQTERALAGLTGSFSLSWKRARAIDNGSGGGDEEMHFIVNKDVETGERAGAGGTFQIASLSIEDPDGNSVDISKLVDQGKHFHSDEDFKEYISGRFNIPLANIDLIAE